MQCGDSVLNAISKSYNCYYDKEKNKYTIRFSFSEVQTDNISKFRKKKLDNAKILSQNSENFVEYRNIEIQKYRNIYYFLNYFIFPSDLQIVDVTPAYKKKKKSKTYKGNYKPVSILSNISKIYERYIYDQLQKCFGTSLSKQKCYFRKGYNAQYCSIALIEKWIESVDNGGA